MALQTANIHANPASKVVTYVFEYAFTLWYSLELAI